MIPLAYRDVVDLLAQGVPADRLLAYHPSEATQARVEALVRRAKQEALPPEEAAELAHYQTVEHLMRLAKAQARAQRAAGSVS